MTAEFNILSLSLNLLDALQQFDAALKPEGLYASQEHKQTQKLASWTAEWDRCIRPLLVSNLPDGYFIDKNVRGRSNSFKGYSSGRAGFKVPGNGLALINMFRL